MPGYQVLMEMENKYHQPLLLGQTGLLRVQCPLSAVQDLDQPCECQALAHDGIKESSSPTLLQECPWRQPALGSKQP